ncbi:MAG: cyclopropane-fatty-acyl-phospholipid synthase family protein [Pseudomonadota bacterium]
MSLFDRFLSNMIKNGVLTVTLHDGQVRKYGTPAEGYPDIAVRMADSRVARDIALKPELGAGEAYMDHRLIVENDDIMGLLTLIRLNSPWEDGKGVDDAHLVSRLWGRLQGKLDRWNWDTKSKRNVAHHYDLDDRLYDLFLDENRQYSCGYFREPGNDLDTAQRDKMAHIAAKLDLHPGMRVLDIGSGWGGMSLYLNKHFDVDVLGITLSEEQLKWSRASAEKAGVADRVKFELVDYRNVTGTFDRIVSVGMFEHVGPPHYNAFYRKCRELLTADGAMLLHTIGRMSTPGTTDEWASKYIFPGGYAPSLSEMTAASERYLIQTDCETWRLHYAWTLRHWYARIMANRAEIEQVYDARFFRMWQFYFAGCTSAFEHGVLCVYQLQYAKNRRALPVTRDYMHKIEDELRRR